MNEVCEMTELNVMKMIDLKNIICKLLGSKNDTEFPLTINYSRGIEHEKYKITIEKYEEDFFIDSKGAKWVKLKNDE